MFFVERYLGVGDAAPERLVPAPSQPSSSAKLTFYFDYASPWSYLATLRMEELLRSVAPISLSVEWVPVLVGALFKKIGTPVVSKILMGNHGVWVIVLVMLLVGSTVCNERGQTSVHG